MSKMKKFGFLATLTACLVGVVGCGNETTTTQTTEIVTSVTEPVEIEFWHSMSGDLGKALEQIIENFNTGVGAEKDIVVHGVYQGGYEDLKSKTIGAIKSGNAPAVIQGTTNVIMELTQSNMIQPLDEYIFHKEIGIHDYADIYEVYREEATSFDTEGLIYALPFAKSTDVFVYNETFFNEHQLEVPTSWDELVELSKEIYEITGNPGFGIDNLANFYVTMLEQHKQPYTDKDGNILFAHDTSVQILEDLKTHVQSGYWRIAGSDIYNTTAFLGEQVYSYIGSSAGISFLHDEKFTFNTAPIPQLSNDVNDHAYIQQGNMVSVINQGKSSSEVYAAYEFVKHLCSQESNLSWVMNTGYLPIRQSVASSVEYLEYLKESGDRVKENGAISIQNAFSEDLFITDSSNSNLVRNEVGVMIEEILLTDVEIRETLERYKAKLEN